jgi:hypothetical protein
MEDRSLGIWLIALFGVSGLAIIVLGWLWPVLSVDRLTATAGGGFGLAVAGLRAITLRHNRGRQVPVSVEVED